MIGQTLAHYDILDKLGAGGMGEVYLARDTKLDREVALKIPPREVGERGESWARFQREAKAISALNHPNIVTIYSVEEADDVPFITMELVRGKTLRELIPLDGFSLDAFFEISVQLADAVRTAHEEGIVHRDLKPANVMVTESGRVKVLDFGLARALASAGADSESPTLPMTQEGVVLGTVHYMSPEQAEGRRVDHRTDIFSMGIVFYEMLTGKRPFGGDDYRAVARSIVSFDPARLSSLRPEVPEALSQTVHRALAKDVDDRYASMADVVDALERSRPHVPPRPDLATILRQPRFAVPTLVAVLMVASLSAWMVDRGRKSRWARNVALPEIERLTQQLQWPDAYRLIREAERYIPDDPQLQALKLNASLPVAIHTTPEGAEVYFKGYRDVDGPYEHLGTSPLDPMRVPAGYLRYRVEKQGFESVHGAFDTWLTDTLHFELSPVDSQPPGMVLVPGGSLLLGNRDVNLQRYWIDQYEVTNEAFKTFVDAGGYRTEEYWGEYFATDDLATPWGEVVDTFRDATGRTGPGTWELGTFPEGEADYPVRAVSWYEAAAYCAFAGKALPTVYHWSMAAGHGIYADILLLSNIGTSGVAAAGRYRGMSPYGGYDMAGNVKEWCFNGVGRRRHIAGGAWNEPDYMFAVGADAQSPLHRSDNLGFRCAAYSEAVEETLTAPVDLLTQLPAEVQPVSDEVFGVYERLYAYDRFPLDANVESTDETADWRREIVTFDAAYGDERVIAYLFLPKNAPEPYQTIVYFPGSMADRLPSIETTAEMAFVDFLPKSGRALMFPVYKGTYERRSDVTPRGPNAVRDRVFQWSKDLGRSLDYLETRPDIDAERFAFYGLSYGAMLGPVLTAFDGRIAASILLSGGLPSLPQECDPVNFAPRNQTPTLMIAGRNDFMRPVETNQRVLFDLLGASDDDKRLAVLEGGHTPESWTEAVREILDWLDKYLGPVPPVQETPPEAKR